MVRPHPHRIHLKSPIRDLRVELSDEGWMVWLAANGDWTVGTFLLLTVDGKITRVTWHPDGSETRFEL
jgi:hypothetical protein